MIGSTVEPYELQSGCELDARCANIRVRCTELLDLPDTRQREIEWSKVIDACWQLRQALRRFTNRIGRGRSSYFLLGQIFDLEETIKESSLDESRIREVLKDFERFDGNT